MGEVHNGVSPVLCGVFEGIRSGVNFPVEVVDSCGVVNSRGRVCEFIIFQSPFGVERWELSTVDGDVLISVMAWVRDSRPSCWLVVDDPELIEKAVGFVVGIRSESGGVDW